MLCRGLVRGLLFKAGLPVLTGDAGPHASRVPASLIIIFHAAAPPPVAPTESCSTDLGTTRIRL